MSYRVLVAEDHSEIRKLVHLCLAREGYELFEATDGREALSKARDLTPDLIVLDVMMPNMTGYEVCDSLKSDPSTSRIKILFLTSRTGVPARAAMNEAGADDIMTKPFKPGELREKVSNMLTETVQQARSSSSDLS